MRTSVIWLVLGAVWVGVLSEAWVYDVDEPQLWLPDLLAGWTLCGSGILAWATRRAKGVGVLLGAAGITWFLALSPPLLFLHRGPLVHLLVTYPGWRPRSRLEATAVTTGYVSAIAPALWANDTVSIVASLALLTLVGAQFLEAERGDRSRRLPGLAATVVLVVGVVSGAVARVRLGPDAALPALLIYETAVACAAVLLLVGLPQRSATRLADLVVDLGDDHTGLLRERLADALDDPSVAVGYWSPRGRCYRAVDGVVVTPDAPGIGRVATLVNRAGSPFAVLVHDSQALKEPALVAAVERAVRVADANATLREQTEEQRRRIEESRQRLILAVDDELGRLDQRLRRGPETLLARVQEALSRLDDGPGQHLQRAGDHARLTSMELRTLSRGLRPIDLDGGGLEGAVNELVSRLACPVTVHVVPAGLHEVIETTAYFVCAEALSNVAKHAQATSVRVDLSLSNGSLVVSVQDDGVGGASIDAGSGLSGLTDRVAAIGGVLDVRSSAGGTTVCAVLPAEIQAG